MNISILILTKNEAMDLPACIESVRWSDDIHVFDSFSSDDTPNLARRLGASVVQRNFDDYASHRNAALTSLAFKYSWVLSLDADERVPAELAAELHRFTGNVAPEIVAVRIRRKDYFLGTWLKHSQISPFYIRLVKPGQVHYERAINEVLIPHGQVSELKEAFIHFPFSKGISHWIKKHNEYSSMEAKRALEERKMVGQFKFRLALFEPDFNLRRMHQKAIFFRLPFRPLLKFVYMILVRRAFMDGAAGFNYAILQCIYEYLIVLKQKEMRRLDHQIKAL